MLEFAYGEVAPSFGPSRNPWHTGMARAGRAVARRRHRAGFGFALDGLDTGGSIRLPAAYCGIVGLKPTYGLVSRAGVLPLSWSLDHVGPMTRTVRDCALTLAAIAGHDPDDPTTTTRPAPSYGVLLDQPPPDCVIGIVESAEDDGVTPEVRAAVDAAAERARQLGFTCRPGGAAAPRAGGAGAAGDPLPRGERLPRALAARPGRRVRAEHADPPGVGPTLPATIWRAPSRCGG
ncbi:MAG: amidase family protein [Chloroflexia bacterium]